MEHTKTEPFLVGALGDLPAQAAARHGWEILLGGRRCPGGSTTVDARGKAGRYRIVSERTGCKAYPVAS